MFHTLTVGLPDTTLYLRLIGFVIGDVKDHPMRWLLLKVPEQLSIVTEPPDTSSQTVHQYVVPGVFSMVVIGVYSPGFSVTWALGLLIRFVTIIGHHPPDGRSYARGIVSPVKKPGSPPHGFIVSVGRFDEDLAHHADQADLPPQLHPDEEKLASFRNRDLGVHREGLPVGDRLVQQLLPRGVDVAVDDEIGGGLLRVYPGVHVIRASRWDEAARQ